MKTKNGTFVNLTELPIEAVNKIKDYIKYVEEQIKILKMLIVNKQASRRNILIINFDKIDNLNIILYYQMTRDITSKKFV